MENLNITPKIDPSQTTESKLSALYSGQRGKAPWERLTLLLLLLLTAVAYIWGLGQSGWANSFYAAAVQAGTKSWEAFFFGSIDASNFITVDKTPASLWVMELSARIFGMNSWSMLVPEALEGVTCVWVLYITIRRWFSPKAALIAGTVLAITPVAALMFRFNNPDALLVLLLTASAYFFTRALEDGKTKWLVWASILIGFGFLTKMLAAFLIIPVLVVVYLLFAPVSVRRRLLQMVISAFSVVASAGWWVAIVQLIPAANRPYIGSSQKNSILDLIFGYNGVGRLTGNESGMNGQTSAMGAPSGDLASQASNMGAPGGNMASQAHGMGGNFSGSTGLTRLFNSEMGGQISWLIPAALILLVVAVWLVRRHWKSDRTVAALVLWAGTFLVTGVVFSFSAGTIHSYYTVALAPSIGALIGICAEVLWKQREQLVARFGLAAAIAATAVWSYFLLDRTPTWNSWLRFVIIIIGGLAAITIAVGARLSHRLMIGAAAAGVIACLAGPFAYTVQTIATPHTGSTPTAGPETSGGGFSQFGSGQTQPWANANTSFTGQFGNMGPEGGQMPPGANSTNSSIGKSENTDSANNDNNSETGSLTQGDFGAPDNATASSTIVKLLQKDASKYTWAAATVGSQSSAPYQLASSEPIMDIGGFTGSDPTPTLAQFKKYVSEGKIHYYINAGSSFNRMGSNTSTENTNGNNTTGNFQGGPMAGGSNSEIAVWVKNNFKSITVDGVTLYDLTQPNS